MKVQINIATGWHFPIWKPGKIKNKKVQRACDFATQSLQTLSAKPLINKVTVRLNSSDEQAKIYPFLYSKNQQNIKKNAIRKTHFSSASR